MEESEKMKKITIVIFLSFILALTIIPFSVAANEGIVAEDERCTSFYFGKDTTENGTYIWGRTEDVSAAFGKLFNVEPAADYNIDPVRYNNYNGNWSDYQGDMFVSGQWNADFTTFTPMFRWPYPSRTLRYTYNADSIYNERNEPRPYAEVGMNEKGVSISATESLSAMKSDVTSIDRSVTRANGGITEVDVTSLILMQAETARGACELLAKVIDTVGAGGREGLFLSDPNEVWYFQWFTGHQYVAAKCPDNMVGFSPNITGNVGPNGVVDITDKENFIVSPNLVNVAVEAGVYVGDPTDPGNLNKIKVCDSYGSTTNHQTGRMRIGWGLFYGYTKDAEIALNVPGNVYMDFFLKPQENRKYSLYEAMRMFAGRGQGTDWEAASGIATPSTVECSVYELRPNMPSDIATVHWMTMAPPEFNVYLPYYSNLITEVYEKMVSPDAGRYNSEQTGYDNANPDNNSMYWVLRELHTQCNLSVLTERARIGNGVLDFWEKYQKALIADQALIDQRMISILAGEGIERAQEVATAISMALCEQTYKYAKDLLAEVKAFKDSGTGNFTPSFSATPLYAGLIPVITIDVQPQATITITEGDISGALSVSVSATEDAALTYQWYSNNVNNNTGGTPIEGATNASFELPTTLSAGTYYYYCVVSAAYSTVTSNTVRVTVEECSSGSGSGCNAIVYSYLVLALFAVAPFVIKKRK